MSARVGEAVDDNERPFAAVDDQGLRAVGLLLDGAEDAAFVSVRFDVFHPPGREDAFHGGIVAKNPPEWREELATDEHR
jgi:hypothetical protein